jgi:glutamine amidotransferase
MNVAIVKYNAGNVYSVVNALRRLGIEPMLTDDAEQLRTADKVLFPGQGEASGAMAYLKARRLDEVIRDLKQPVLGICIGQQLLCRHSEEGDTDCIGIFDAEVKRFQPQRHEDKVPCMGWQNLTLTLSKGEGTPSPLFKGLYDPQALPSFGGVGGGYVYFVHSYYVPVCAETIATADYILPYSASMHKDNFYTCQFHPEKSGKVGEQILRNFLSL